MFAYSSVPYFIHVYCSPKNYVYFKYENFSNFMSVGAEFQCAQIKMIFYIFCCVIATNRIDHSNKKTIMEFCCVFLSYHKISFVYWKFHQFTWLSFANKQAKKNFYTKNQTIIVFFKRHGKFVDCMFWKLKIAFYSILILFNTCEYNNGENRTL